MASGSAASGAGSRSDSCLSPTSRSAAMISAVSTVSTGKPTSSSASTMEASSAPVASEKARRSAVSRRCRSSSSSSLATRSAIGAASEGSISTVPMAAFARSAYSSSLKRRSASGVRMATDAICSPSAAETARASSSSAVTSASVPPSSERIRSGVEAASHSATRVQPRLSRSHSRLAPCARLILSWSACFSRLSASSIAAHASSALGSDSAMAASAGPPAPARCSWRVAMASHAAARASRRSPCLAVLSPLQNFSSAASGGSAGETLSPSSAASCSWRAAVSFWAQSAMSAAFCAASAAAAAASFSTLRRCTSGGSSSAMSASAFSLRAAFLSRSCSSASSLPSLSSSAFSYSRSASPSRFQPLSRSSPGGFQSAGGRSSSLRRSSTARRPASIPPRSLPHSGFVSDWNGLRRSASFFSASSLVLPRSPDLTLSSKSFALSFTLSSHLFASSSFSF
mmetsp:Transcript_31772/g.104913  ORF Transcript_31772/g.104913 Transcript_31772/m.104913 type:complete len:457 (+) Transcript_31772:728-2098(+)